jgi:nitrate reductase gamma subunit
MIVVDMIIGIIRSRIVPRASIPVITRVMIFTIEDPLLLLDSMIEVVLAIGVMIDIAKMIDDRVIMEDSAMIGTTTDDVMMMNLPLHMIVGTVRTMFAEQHHGIIETGTEMVETTMV